MNILLVEDDRRIAGLEECGRKEDGHCVQRYGKRRKMLEKEYDFALLDIILSGMDGLCTI